MRKCKRHASDRPPLVAVRGSPNSLFHTFASERYRPRSVRSSWSRFRSIEKSGFGVNATPDTAGQAWRAWTDLPSKSLQKRSAAGLVVRPAFPLFLRFHSTSVLPVDNMGKTDAIEKVPSVSSSDDRKSFREDVAHVTVEDSRSDDLHFSSTGASHRTLGISSPEARL